MKLVHKGREPEAFSRWKNSGGDWRPSWDKLMGTQKGELRRALEGEQGHICCYCNAALQGLSQEIGSIIEHLKPRSGFPERALAYDNLLASCESRESCGTKKGDWFDPLLMVSPLDSDCENVFSYTTKGKIRPNPAGQRIAAAEETILRLGLNNKNLIQRRKARLDEARKALLKQPDKKNEILRAAKNRNEQGRHQPFCMSSIWFLSSFE